MRSTAVRPPPLPYRRHPVSLTVRAALWRWRFAVCAAFLGIAAGSTAQALRPSPAPTVDVVVTARAIDAGTALTSDDVRIARLPSAVVPDGSLHDVSAVAGASTAVALTAGVPIVPGVLAPDAVRGPSGTVVATVRFTDPAVAGLLSPGVRVDVLAATAEGGPGGVVATRALVLPLARGTFSEAGLLGGSGGDDSVPVLLAVAPDEAAALAGAAASAMLSAVVVP